MSHLSLVPATQSTERHAAPHPGAAQMAHDIRNALTTIGLHLETLERLAGTAGAKAAGAGHALVAKAATLCNLAIENETGSAGRSRRTAVDMAHVARDVVGLIEAAMPAGLEVEIESDGRVMALADPNAAFRILFNLVNNAVTVARANAKLRKLNISITRDGTTVAVRIADDGPGLPAAVRKALFKPVAQAASGQGLAIVRELVERSGGAIRLEPTAKGATFVMTLPAFASMLVRESPVTRSLGRRIS
jgi:signal transduction histidine kinase